MFDLTQHGLGSNVWMNEREKKAHNEENEAVHQNVKINSLSHLSFEILTSFFENEWAKNPPKNANTDPIYQINIDDFRFNEVSENHKNFRRTPINKGKSLAANSTKFNQIFDMDFRILWLCLVKWRCCHYHCCCFSLVIGERHNWDKSSRNQLCWIIDVCASYLKLYDIVQCSINE